MKIRILPLLTILFAFTLIGRSYNISVASPNIDEKSKPQNKVPKTESIKKTEPKTCITGDMLLSVNEKLAYFEKREEEFLAKQAAFKSMQKRMQQQMEAIKKAKAELDFGVRDRTKLAEQDIVHLTTMYQTMKPKQAAAIFNEMDVNFAAGFLRKMKSNQAGLILSNMEAKKAYQISLIIASKRAKYRKLKTDEAKQTN